MKTTLPLPCYTQTLIDLFLKWNNRVEQNEYGVAPYDDTSDFSTDSHLPPPPGIVPVLTRILELFPLFLAPLTKETWVQNKVSEQIFLWDRQTPSFQCHDNLKLELTHFYEEKWSEFNQREHDILSIKKVLLWQQLHVTCILFCDYQPIREFMYSCLLQRKIPRENALLWGKELIWVNDPDHHRHREILFGDPHMENSLMENHKSFD